MFDNLKFTYESFKTPQNEIGLGVSVKGRLEQLINTIRESSLPKIQRDKILSNLIVNNTGDVTPGEFPYGINVRNNLVIFKPDEFDPEMAVKLAQDLNAHKTSINKLAGQLGVWIENDPDLEQKSLTFLENLGVLSLGMYPLKKPLIDNFGISVLPSQNNKPKKKNFSLLNKINLNGHDPFIDDIVTDNTLFNDANLI
jgi:hypothetical protein